MPGPSSPARKRNLQQKATRSKRARPHYPSPTSPVLQLPDTLSDAGRMWWNPYIGKEFLEKKKQRGNTKGAKGWARKTFCDKWWLENLPDVDVSRDDKIWYFDKTDIGNQIYSYLNNSSTRGTPGIQPKPPTALKARAYGHDQWRRENTATYVAAVEEWKATHQAEPNLGEARAISSEAFKKLPQDEQAKWKQAAKDSLVTHRALVRLTDPNELADYIANFKQSLASLMKEADAVAGIQLCSLILYENLDGNYKIDRKLSDGIRGFKKSPALANTMSALQKFIADTAGKTVEDGPPMPTVYPDYSNNQYPLLPNYVGWKLEPLQDLMRSYVKAIYRFQGGVGRLIWTEIKLALDHWFDPDRLPLGLESEWGDPSSLPMTIVVSWVDYFIAGQTGKLPNHKMFQFLRIPAGLTPIHPSESEEACRELVGRGGKQMWVLMFKDTVTMCHQVGGMLYPQRAFDFADYLSSGIAYADADSAPPRHWNKLPVLSPNIPDRIITNTEHERYMVLSALLPDSQKNRVISLVDAVNDHQHHIPATDPKGVYASTIAPPKLIPSSPQSRDAPESTWLVRCYYQSLSVAPLEGSVNYFEGWQDNLLETNVLRHEPSGTLYGGATGVVCVARALIQLFFNFSAVRGDFKCPEDPPADYDLTRLPVHEWPRLLQWIDTWIAAINDSTRILSLTSDERRKGLGSLQSQHSEELEDYQEPVASGSHPAAILDPKSSNNLPQTEKMKNPKKKSKSKGKMPADSGDETSAASSDSEDNGSETNFEELDKTSQDDESDDDWRTLDEDIINHELIRPSPELAGGAGSANTLGDDDSEFDRLGLRLRYGFTGDVNCEAHAENGPVATTSDCPGALTPTSGVFGRFLELPPYEKVHFHTPHAIVNELSALDAVCTKYLKDFDAYMATNAFVPSSILENSPPQVQDHDPHIQLLHKFLRVRQAAWRHAKTISPGVFGHAQRIALVFREGLQLFLTAQNTIERGVFPDPALTAFDLAKSVRRSKRTVVELRWVTKELLAFQGLATKWNNTLRANWMDGDIPTDLAELVELTEGLINWGDEMAGLISRLRSKRKADWAKFVMEPFPQRHLISGMNYRFGCPTTREEPEGMRDAFAHMKSLLAHTPMLPLSTLVPASIEGQQAAPTVAIPIASNLPPAVDSTAAPHDAPAATATTMTEATPPVAERTSTPAAAHAICASTPDALAIPSSATPAALPSAAQPPIVAPAGTATAPLTAPVTPAVSVPVAPPSEPAGASLQESAPPVVATTPPEKSTTETTSRKRKRDAETAPTRASGRLVAAKSDPVLPRTRSGAVLNGTGAKAICAEGRNTRATTAKGTGSAGTSAKSAKAVGPTANGKGAGGRKAQKRK